MSAVAIFVCHDCKIATTTPTEDASNHYAVIGPMATRVEKLFSAEHPGHDIKVVSDAHGQISPRQYNFEKRQFDFDGFY